MTFATKDTNEKLIEPKRNSLYRNILIKLTIVIKGRSESVNLKKNELQEIK